MRKGFEGQTGLVRPQRGEDPLSGHLFLFANSARTRLKFLFLSLGGQSAPPLGGMNGLKVHHF